MNFNVCMRINFFKPILTLVLKAGLTSNPHGTEFESKLC